MITGHEGMHTNEMVELVTLIQSVKPESMLEIGVHYGQTAKVFLDNVPSISRYVGVDLWDPSALWTKQKGDVPTYPGRDVKGDARFELVMKRFGSFDLIARKLGVFDVVFIDGDHSLFGVMHDTGLAVRIAKKLIVWHDYNEHVDVKAFLDFVRPWFTNFSIEHIAGTWLAYHRVTP
jgi:predicted O-methyltransferase YrrM